MPRDLSSTIGSVAGVWKGGKGARGKTERQTNQALTFPEPGKYECRTTCGFCATDDPERFDMTGPVEEVKDAFAAHVASAHPERSART